MLETPEVPIKNPEDPINQRDDSPPETDAPAFEPMNTNVNPAPSHEPPSPKPTSPAKSTDKSSSDDNFDDIAVTVSTFKALEVSRMLAKHSCKEETPSLEKGKAKLYLQSYADFSTGEV